MHTRHFAPMLLVFTALTALAQERPSTLPPPSTAPAPPAAPAAAAPAPTPTGQFPGVPTVALEPLLQRVGRAANKRFLLDGHVNPQVYLGGVDANDVTYPLLLSILRTNLLAAVEIEGRINVIFVAQIRNYPVPFANTDDPSIAADEWRTRVLPLTNAEAVQLVPILRPLLPQEAHLAALASSNQLLIVDRYANLKRITEIVRALDKPSSR